MNNNQVSVVWRYIAVILIAVTIALAVAMYTVTNTKIKIAVEEAGQKAVAEETVPETTQAAEEESDQDAQAADISGATMLSLWTDTAPLKKQLISYVERVTDENSSSFIPEERRVATFDLDGTLFCETDPTYFVDVLMLHRILEDEGYKDSASKFEKKTAEKLLDHIETGAEYENLDGDVGSCIASAFSGVTLEDLDNYVQAFKALPMPGYDGMYRGDGWYLPMVQVVNYLEANGFEVYIVSGTDRFVLRSLVHNSQMNVPDSRLIGSGRTLAASGQGDANALAYTFTSEDKLVTGSETTETVIQMNKVNAIAREIGLQPVLAFGNSGGDASMLEYTITNNPYESMAFMLCCDDLEREYGNQEKADAAYRMCSDNHWTPVSMKNDWITIYGDGVTKKLTVVDAAG